MNIIICFKSNLLSTTSATMNMANILCMAKLDNHDVHHLIRVRKLATEL